MALAFSEALDHNGQPADAIYSWRPSEMLQITDVCLEMPWIALAAGRCLIAWAIW